MHDENTLVFVEVRFRRSEAFGSGAESISCSKRRNLIQAAQLYLQSHRCSAWPDCRFDVVEARPGTPFELEWIRDAFEA